MGGTDYGENVTAHCGQANRVICDQGGRRFCVCGRLSQPSQQTRWGEYRSAILVFARVPRGKHFCFVLLS